MNGREARGGKNNLGGLIGEERIELGVEILHEIPTVFLDNLPLGLGGGRGKGGRVHVVLSFGKSHTRMEMIRQGERPG